MKRAFTLIEAVVIIGVVLLIAAFLYPIFARARYVDHKVSCMSNLKQLGLGVMQYVQDYDERFPLAHSSETVGWGDGIYPYVKSTSIFQCPNATQSGGVGTPSPTSEGEVAFTSDYFYNRLLEGVLQRKIFRTGFTILAGDGLDDEPSWSSQIEMLPNAITNTASPAWRHGEDRGAFYVFADGHVKAFFPNQISNTSVQGNIPTFALK